MRGLNFRFEGGHYQFEKLQSRCQQYKTRIQFSRSRIQNWALQPSASESGLSICGQQCYVRLTGISISCAVVLTGLLWFGNLGFGFLIGAQAEAATPDIGCGVQDAE